LARILRGEVYWADLNPVRGREQAGLRPVLILSQDLFNKVRHTNCNGKLRVRHSGRDFL